MSERILIVDDEAVLRSNIVRFLRRTGHRVEEAASGEEALERLQEADYAIVITDLKMPGMGGAELLKRIAVQYPETLVLIVTAFASLDSALDALRHGAQDYLLKPLSLEEVTRKVDRLLQFRALELRVRRLRAELHQQFDTGSMVAESSAMRPVMKLLGKAAASRSTVLVEGESGTGKELVARSLHDLSPWSDKDFIAVNLAAQPRDLVDSTLFGHERAAFTGADQRREGVFRAARGGTVFLDEVADLPAEVQVKLLRVLENREVLPLGADKPVPVDFRLVAATNQPLRALVEAGGFREDLYYRLEDIPPLVEQLLKRFSQGRPAPRLTNEAMRSLQAHPWPGNIRELSNVIERAVLLHEGDWIRPEDLSVSSRGSEVAITELKPALASFERQHIERVLNQCDGDKTSAAELLGMHLATLYRRIERLGLSEGEDPTG